MSGRGTQPRYHPGSFSQRLLPGDSRHHHLLFARSEGMDNSGCGEPGLRGTVVIQGGRFARPPRRGHHHEQHRDRPQSHHAQRRAERRRRHRRIAAVITLAGLAALILGVGATRNLNDSTAPPSPATTGPHPARGLLTLKADPYETGIDGLPLRPGIPPEALWTCISSPLTWGAVESRGATFGRPGEDRVYNEFLLRYDSVADAHRAVADAPRQAAHSCGTRTGDPRGRRCREPGPM